MSFDDVSYVSMERTWTPAITGYRPKGIRTKNAVPRRGERHSLSVHRLPALFLILVDLLLDRVQTQVDRLLERLAAALGQQLVSRYVDRSSFLTFPCAGKIPWKSLWTNAL